jgi:hypothetical protein
LFFDAGAAVDVLRHEHATLRVDGNRVPFKCLVAEAAESESAAQIARPSESMPEEVSRLEAQRIPSQETSSRCRRPPGPRKDALWGGPDVIRRRVPKSLRDPGGPFVLFPRQTLRSTAGEEFIPVTVRCALPADLVCRGTLRIQAGRFARKSTIVTLGSAPMRLAGKHQTILKVRIDASGRRLLRRHRPRSVRALAIPYTKSGFTSSRTLALAT